MKSTTVIRLVLPAFIVIASSGWAAQPDQTAATKSGGGEGYSLKPLAVVGNKYTAVPTQTGTATKSMLPLIDVPATVTVIRRALMDAQQATELQDILRNASGLNQAGNNYGVGDFLHSRGLPVSYAYDGIYGGAGLGPDAYAPTRSLTNIERVEVLQGANATLYGAGAAGGMVNLIEKKPQFSPAYGVEAQVGSYDHYRFALDLTAPLNDRFAYRIVSAAQRENGFRRLANDKNELYGSLSMKLAGESLLTLSAGWLDDKVQIDSIGYPVRIYNAASATPAGIPAGQAGPRNLPNDPAARQQLTPDQIRQLANSLKQGDGLQPFDLNGASLISPLSRPNDSQELRLKLRLEWDPVPGLSIIPATQYRRYASEYVRQTGAFNYNYWRRRGVINQPPRAPLVLGGVLYPYAARRQEYRKLNVREKSWDNFLDIRYESELFGMDSETLLTAYYQKIKIDLFRASLYDADNSRSANNPVPYILDIRNPNFPGGRFEDYAFLIRADYKKAVTSKGVGMQNIAYIRPWLITRVGIGWNHIDQDYESRRPGRPGRAPVDHSDSGLVYNVGATVKMLDWASAFVNHAQGRASYRLEGALNGVSDRPDSESKNFELGLKLQSPDGRFSGGITYFDTARTNLRYGNPAYEDNPADPDFNISVPEYLFDGEDTTRGWQFDINANITDALYINANATIQDARNRQNPNASSFNTKRKGVPDSFASVFGVYEPRFTIAGGKMRYSLGYEYQGRRGIASAAFGLPAAKLSAQGVWDAGIEYIHKAWSLKLRVENLTNELAYKRALFLGGQPIAPRAFYFSVQLDL